MEKTVITLVFEWPNREAAPRIGEHTTFMGGKIISCQFNDALKELREAQEKIERLEEAL